MKNVILSTRNIDDFIDDLANEIVNRIDLWNVDNQNTPQQSNNPINIKEVAKLTGLSVATLYGYCQRKEIPFNKVGNRNYFFKSDIIDWIRSGKQKTMIDIHENVDQYLSNKKGLKNG
jgi:excisionase family DNA binding protein